MTAAILVQFEAMVGMSFARGSMRPGAENGGHAPETFVGGTAAARRPGAGGASAGTQVARLLGLVAALNVEQGSVVDACSTETMQCHRHYATESTGNLRQRAPKSPVC